MVRETRHLWVGNLPDNIREDRIREHFTRYGPVQSVKLLPGCTEDEKTGEITMACTVAFMDIKSASKAHNSDLKLDDRPLTTQYYEPAAIPSSATSSSSSLLLSSSSSSLLANAASSAAAVAAAALSSSASSSSTSVGSGASGSPQNAAATSSAAASPYAASPAASRFPNGHGSSDEHGPPLPFSERFYERSTSRSTSSNVATSGLGLVGGYHRTTSSSGTTSRDRSSSTTTSYRNGPTSYASNAAVSDRHSSRGGGGNGGGLSAGGGGTSSAINTINSTGCSTSSSSWGYETTNRYNSGQSDTGYSKTMSNNSERRHLDQNSKKKTISRAGTRSPSPAGSASSRSPSRSRSRSSSSSSTSSSPDTTSSSGSPKCRRSSHHNSTTTINNHSHSHHSQQQQQQQPAVHSDDRRPLAVCVRNLPARSSDTSLKDGLYHEYKKHGKVTWVKVVGQDSERYAIVCFKKPEDVEKALEVSYDKLFFGCKIEVAPYQGYDVEDNDLRPYEAEIDEFHPKATRTLFIGNLEKDVTASDLRKHFDQFGEIIEIDIKKQGAVSSYAFCQYSDIVSVVKAIRKMDGEHLGNNRIKLGFGKSMPYNWIWIDGINEHVNEKYLRIQFEPFGVINKVYIDREKGQALMMYDQVLNAQTAVNNMRGFNLKNTKIQVDYASRECQESFFERLEKQGAVLDRSCLFEDGRRETAAITRFSSTSTSSRYDNTPTTRPRTASYSSRSGGGGGGGPGATPNQVVTQSPGTPGSGTPRSRSRRFPTTSAATGASTATNTTDYYDQDYINVTTTSDRHFRSYDEFSQGSGASHDDAYDPDYGFVVHDSPRDIEPIDARSLHSALDAVVVGFEPPDIRNLQKERVHLLEQLGECASSGDELLITPNKKRLKLDMMLDAPLGAGVGSDVIIEANRDHRKVMEVRRLSDTTSTTAASLKHHSSSSRRPSMDSTSCSQKHSSSSLRHTSSSSASDSAYLPHAVCKRRKTAGSNDSGSNSTTATASTTTATRHQQLNMQTQQQHQLHGYDSFHHQHHHHHHHNNNSGSESVGGSRPGTPLCDERPENLLLLQQPSEPRRVPRDREGPLTLPLPRFAAQLMNRGSVSVAGIKGQHHHPSAAGNATASAAAIPLSSTAHHHLSSPPHNNNNSSIITTASSPRVASGSNSHHNNSNRPPSPPPTFCAPPASPPPRPPSLSSCSSDDGDADGLGGTPAPPSPSLEERIRSLDERYEKWSGNRAVSAAGGDALALLDANLEKFRQRHKLLDLDLKEVQPSEIVKSVMAKRSVFDEDLKRLENVGEKYEPKDFGLFARSTSLPASATATTISSGSGVVAAGAIQVGSTASVATPHLTPSTPVPPPPPTASVSSSMLKIITTATTSMSSAIPSKTSSSSTTVLLSPRSSGHTIAAAKGLQYPFPTHPPPLLISSPVQQPQQSSAIAASPSSSCPSISSPSSSAPSSTNSSAAASINSPNATTTRGTSHSDNNSRLKLCASVPSDTNNRTSSKVVNVNRNPCKISEKNIPPGVNEPNKSMREVKSSDKTSEKVICRRDSNSNNSSPRADVKTRRNSDTSARRIEDSGEDARMKERAQSEERKKEQRLEKIRLENEKLEKERLEKERLEREKQEKSRIEKENLERERLARESELEKQRLEKERLEKERIEKEQLEKEKARLEKERLEREQREREKEKERLEHERLERERRECEERERRQKEELEKKQRLEQERKELEERERKEREEKEMREREEQERKDREAATKLEEERIIKQQQASERERHEKDNNNKKRGGDEERFRHKEDNQHHHHHHQQQQHHDKRKDDQRYSRDSSSTHINETKQQHSRENNKHINIFDNKNTKESNNSKDEKQQVESSSSSSSGGGTTMQHQHDAKSTSHHHHHHENNKSKHYIERDVERRKESIKENRDNNLHDKHKRENNRSSGVIESRHMSIDLDKSTRPFDHNATTVVNNKESGSSVKRKERNNSLPASCLSTKRRLSSSHDNSSLDNVEEQPAAKKIKLSSSSHQEHHNKKLNISERRDSKDSVRSEDQHQPQQHRSKSSSSGSKHNKNHVIGSSSSTTTSSGKSSHDRHNNMSSNKEGCDEKRREKDRMRQERHHKKHKLDKQKSKSKSREKEARESPTTPTPNLLTDKDFLARLDLRSNEDIEKQRKEMKEKRKDSRNSEDKDSNKSPTEEKQPKRDHQQQLCLEKQQQQQIMDRSTKRRNSTDMLDAAAGKSGSCSDEKKKQRSSSTTSAATTTTAPVPPSPVASGCSERPKKLNSSDNTDSDEPTKKHSIFDIVDDEPAYISMYDKVKARSCKNMAKQEEEKRQEKIKAKFSQLKQSRAKREEKKRSTSWDEDSDSDKDSAEMKLKNQQRRSKIRKWKYSSSDSDSSRLYRLMRGLSTDYSDEEMKNKHLIRNIKTRITSDTSEDEDNDYKKKSQIKSELFSDIEHNITNDDVEEKPAFSMKMKEELERLIYKARTQASATTHQESLTDINTTLYNETSSSTIPEKFNNVHNFTENTSDEELGQEEINKKERSERREKKHRKKQKKQKHSISSEESICRMENSLPPAEPTATQSDEKPVKPQQQHQPQQQQLLQQPNVEKKREHSKKEKRRDKLRDSRDKTKKSKRSKSDALNNKMDNIKREGKMENIFGSLSEDSEACAGVKDIEKIKQQQQQLKAVAADTFVDNDTSTTSTTTTIVQPAIFNSDVDREHEVKSKHREERERDREEHRKRKEKKRREKERRLQEAIAAAQATSTSQMEQPSNENSMDFADMGKQLEANMLREDESMEAIENVEKDSTTTNSNSTTIDKFKFGGAAADNPDNETGIIIVPEHQQHRKDKEKDGSKEKKKKRKKSKDEKSNKHHHHHHHEKNKVKMAEKMQLAAPQPPAPTTPPLPPPPAPPPPPPQKPDIPEIKVEIEETTPPSPNTNTTTAASSTSHQNAASLPTLDETPATTTNSTSPGGNQNKSLTPEMCTISSMTPPAIISPIPKTPTTSKDKKRIVGDKLIIPTFDEQVHESAVKSISSEFEQVTKQDDSIKIRSDEDNNANDEEQQKLLMVADEKQRVVISQEETEDAVAALLGESFGGDGQFEKYDEEISNPALDDDNADRPSNLNDNDDDENIVQDDEEMRQAVQSLSATATSSTTNNDVLDVISKPDTPQSEHELQIDTDTEDQDDRTDQQQQQGQQIKTSDAEVSNYFRSSVEEKAAAATTTTASTASAAIVMNNTNVNLVRNTSPPSLTPINNKVVSNEPLKLESTSLPMLPEQKEVVSVISSPSWCLPDRKKTESATTTAAAVVVFKETPSVSESEHTSTAATTSLRQYTNTSSAPPLLKLTESASNTSYATSKPDLLTLSPIISEIKSTIIQPTCTAKSAMPHNTLPPCSPVLQVSKPTSVLHELPAVISSTTTTKSTATTIIHKRLPITPVMTSKPMQPTTVILQQATKLPASTMEPPKLVPTSSPLSTERLQERPPPTRMLFHTSYSPQFPNFPANQAPRIPGAGAGLRHLPPQGLLVPTTRPNNFSSSSLANLTQSSYNVPSIMNETAALPEKPAFDGHKVAPAVPASLSLVTSCIQSNVPTHLTLQPLHIPKEINSKSMASSSSSSQPSSTPSPVPLKPVSPSAKSSVISIASPTPKQLSQLPSPVPHMDTQIPSPKSATGLKPTSPSPSNASDNVATETTDRSEKSSREDNIAVVDEKKTDTPSESSNSVITSVKEIKLEDNFIKTENEVEFEEPSIQLAIEKVTEELNMSLEKESHDSNTDKLVVKEENVNMEDVPMDIAENLHEKIEIKEEIKEDMKDLTFSNKLSTSVKEMEKFYEDKTETESIISDVSKERSSADILAKDDPLDTKEDSDYWSAKEVNIDSVIKTLCSADELSDDHSSENGKDDWFDDNKPNDIKRDDETKEVHIPEKKLNEEITETNVMDNCEAADSDTNEHVDQEEEIKEVVPSRGSSRGRGGRGRGRGKTRGVGASVDRSSIQTRRGGKLKEVPPPPQVVQTTTTTTAKRGRGSGRSRNERKSHKSESSETSPTDIYEFRDESDDTNKEHRPRLILTIKSPAVSNAQTTAIVKEVTKDGAKEIGKEAATTTTSIIKELPQLPPTSAAVANKVVEIVKEDFTPPTPTTNTRKSRRLQEKDTSRNTIDDTIEDVVKNTIQTRSSSNQRRSPRQAAAAAATPTKQQNAQLSETPRKSPRGRNKTRRVSEAAENSSSEETTKEEINKPSIPSPTPPAPTRLNNEHGIKEVEKETITKPAAVATEPVAAVKEKPHEGLKAAVLRRIKGEMLSSSSSSSSSTSNQPQQQHEPTNLIDPVTGELIPMRESEEGKYIPLPGTTTATANQPKIPNCINTHHNNDQPSKQQPSSSVITHQPITIVQQKPQSLKAHVLSSQAAQAAIIQQQQKTPSPLPISTPPPTIIQQTITTATTPLPSQVLNAPVKTPPIPTINKSPAPAMIVTTVTPTRATSNVSPIIISKTTSSIIAAKQQASPIMVTSTTAKTISTPNQHLNINTNLVAPTSSVMQHLSPRSIVTVPTVVTTRPHPGGGGGMILKQQQQQSVVKPPVLSPVLLTNQQKQHILQANKQQQIITSTKSHLVQQPASLVVPNAAAAAAGQVVNTQMAHMKHLQQIHQQQVIMGKTPIIGGKPSPQHAASLHQQQQILTGAVVPSPPLMKSQQSSTPLMSSAASRIVQAPPSSLSSKVGGGSGGVMNPPKVDVSMANMQQVLAGQRPKLSPQGAAQQRLAGIPVPGYEASLGETVAHFPPGPLRPPPDLNPAHYMHPNHVIYQQYLRQQQQQLHLTRLDKTVDGQEGEEAPVTSPPLELRRPGSVGLTYGSRGVAVPHSLHSPHDRATDSPQVGQVYNVHSTVRMQQQPQQQQHYHPGQYYDHPAEPPPAHRPLTTTHASLAALGTALPPDRPLGGSISGGQPPPAMVTAAHIPPDRPIGGHIERPLTAHMGSSSDRLTSSTSSQHHSHIGADRTTSSSHLDAGRSIRPISAHMGGGAMNAGLGAAGNLMGAVARHIGADAPTTQRGLQAATPPHASQVPPQAESLLMLLKQYPCMWQGLLALKNDQAAVQMYFVSGNDDVAKCSLPKNMDGSTPPLRIFQRMRLEPPQVEGVARKMQMENEHCMLLALPCGHDHMDVLKQSRNLTSGFITYLQQKQAAGIVNVAAPGTTQPPAYVVHIFPTCDFVNENLRRIAPSLLERVADIAHLLIVITTV